MMRSRPGPFPSRVTLGILAAVLAGLAGQGLPGQYDPDAPEPIPRLKGALFLGGGGELAGVAYDAFVDMAGGDEAKILVLAATGEDPGAGRFTGAATLFTDVPRRAQTNAFARRLEDATGVWIEGDDGEAFAAVFAGTPVEEGLRHVIARGGIVGGNGGVCRALTRVMLHADSTSAETGTGLDLVPGATVDTAFSDVERKMRMVGVITAQPTVVGLGIDAGTVMILDERFIDVLGSGSVYSYIAANEQKPARVERINRQVSPASQRRTPERQAETDAIIAGWRASQQQEEGQRGGGQRGRGQRGGGQRGRGRGGQGEADPVFRARRLADLISMSREAVLRTQPPFPPEEPPAPRLENGTLMIVGGGGNPPGLTERFIELAGGPDDAYLVYVPCEEAEVIEREPGIVDTWRRMGVRSATWIHTKDREKANTDETILRHLRNATGIWFGGGRQWNLVDSYQNTTAHKLMEEVLARGGVIGGSSAGASIQGSFMIRGDPMGNVDPIAPGYYTGLGFIDLAIDQHFTQRGRFPDMTEFADKYPQMLGVGLDEASSIIVQGSVAEVFTREGRNVHFYDRSREAEEGEPDYVELVHGQLYDLVERKVLDVTEASAARVSVEAPAEVAAVEAQSPFVGTWQLKGQSDFGESTGSLEIGPDMSVSYELAGFEAEGRNLRIEDDQITFDIAGGNQASVFRATLEDGVLTGTVSFKEQVLARVVGRKNAAAAEAAAVEPSALVGRWEITSYSDFGETTSILRIGPELAIAYENSQFQVFAQVEGRRLDGSLASAA